MTDVEAFKCISQLNGCMMIRYEVFMADLIFTLNLVGDQLDMLQDIIPSSVERGGDQ